MNALATSFGRLPAMRRRESKKQIKPINVDAAQNFQSQAPGPSRSTTATSHPIDQYPSTSLTPPQSPLHIAELPSSSTSPLKSPIRRALSRTFFFGSNSGGCGNGNVSGNSTHGRDACSRATTPMQISAPLMDRDPILSSPDSFDAESPPRTWVQNRRRSRTLLPAPPIEERKDDSVRARTTRRPASSSSRIRSFWAGESSSDSSPSASITPSMRQGSLRTIRQLHNRALSPFGPPVTPAPLELLDRPRAPLAPIADVGARRITRRASEESFFCRGLGHDSVDPLDIPEVPHTAPLPGMAARRLSNFTQDAYGPFEVAITTAATNRHGADLTTSTSSPTLTGLGFTDCSPEAPRPKAKRLSVASQVSDVSSLYCDSFYSSTSSLHSLATSETSSSASHASWPEAPAQWFSSCPPTPPSAIRLRLQFLSLPCKKSASAVASATLNDDPPFDALFVSSNNSVLDLKEILAERLRSKGYRVLPKELSISLNLADSLYQLSLARRKSPCAPSALGLAFNDEGRSPIKHLANNSRLLFEEGAQEDDTMIVRYLPLEVSARFF